MENPVGISAPYKSAVSHRLKTREKGSSADSGTKIRKRVSLSMTPSILLGTLILSNLKSVGAAHYVAASMFSAVIFSLPVLILSFFLMTPINYFFTGSFECCIELFPVSVTMVSLLALVNIFPAKILGPFKVFLFIAAAGWWLSKFLIDRWELENKFRRSQTLWTAVSVAVIALGYVPFIFSIAAITVGFYRLLK